MMRERLVRRMVQAGETEPAIEPAPTRASGQRRVTSAEAHVGCSGKGRLAGATIPGQDSVAEAAMWVRSERFSAFWWRQRRTMNRVRCPLL